jgi:hypothetical protein
MEHLTFPFSADGLTLEVLIGLDGNTTAALHVAGQSITPPVRARELLDTGTDVTAVAPWVYRQLGLQPRQYVSTHGGMSPKLDPGRTLVMRAGRRGLSGWGARSLRFPCPAT